MGSPFKNPACPGTPEEGIGLCPSGNYGGPCSSLWDHTRETLGGLQGPWETLSLEWKEEEGTVGVGDPGDPEEPRRQVD